MEKNKQIAATATFLLILFTVLMSAQTKVKSGYIRKYSRWIVADRIENPRPKHIILFCKRC